MDEKPFYRRPWFYIAGWMAFLLLMYGAQIYRMGGWRANQIGILFDLLCLFPLFFMLWMAFFAQFVLPVKTFRDRQKIFDRLRSHFSRGHGPALFIENGVIKEHSGERLKRGPGVVWLDSASAAVTRSAVAIKQTLGPGVHFIERGEFIAGTLDLHTQVQSFGPRDKDIDKLFDELKENATEEERQIQNRRKMVSALTRDGIEVIPNISVIFRVDTGFPAGNEPGSRFGYRTGITKRARGNEKKDQDAIRKAILGQGINPNVEPDSVRHRIAWNELPASLAVDVWREYAAKFTLDELFAAGQDVPPPPPPLIHPVEEDVDPLSQPIVIDPNRRTMQSGLASMLREINKLMDRAIKYLENDTSQPVTPPAPGPATSPGNGSEEPVKKTALQVINEMVTARLTQRQVDVLSDSGQRGEGKVDSEEFKLLEERGLKVFAVSISNIRMDPSLEDQLIKQFSSSWLKTARAESDQLDRKRNVIEISAQERAHIDYATQLSREVTEQAGKGKPEVKEMLKTLLLRSRRMIRSGEHSDQLRRRMITELQEIEELIRWVEETGK